MNTRKIGCFVLIAFLFICADAQAALFRVGPTDLPSPPASGFPLWYQDTSGLALDLCLPQNQAELNAGVCLLLPTAQDPLTGINLPLVFPANFPDEAFFWNATAILDMPDGSKALLDLALEAAFGLDKPGVNDQITFARVRIRIDTPVPGKYTVTHPYGVEIFPGAPADKRGINFTADVGIGSPGDFKGALKGSIGPFLLAADAPGGTALPFVTVPGGDPDSLFLSDAATPVFVTGSPFNTNFFRICGPPSSGFDGSPETPCLQQDLFTVMGKVHADPIGSPMSIERATYTRAGAEAKVDVFAIATAGLGAPAPVLSMGDAAGTSMQSVLMTGPTTPELGQFYGQGHPTDPNVLPAAVIVTNTSDNPPSSLTRKLADEVTISQASYDPNAGTLTIVATSGDKTATPGLFAIGLPGSSTGSEPLTLTNNPADPAERQLVAFPLGPVPPAVPPAFVTIQSTAGGQDSQPVTTVAGGAFPAGGPVAVDDFVSVETGTATAIVDVLANDSGFDPTTVAIVGTPRRGTVSVSPTGQVTYVLTNPAVVGSGSFRYTVRTAPGGLQSNVATATIEIRSQAGVPVPVATPDGPFTVPVNGLVRISIPDLMANDLSNGGTIEPASFALVQNLTTGGTAALNLTTNTVNFRAGSTAGTFGFSYTISNTNGQRSAPASVTVTVVPATDVVTISLSRFISGKGRWDVAGTAVFPKPANTMSVSLIRNGAVISTLGSASVDSLGNWSLRVFRSTVIPEPGDSVLAVSAAGASSTRPVLIK